MKLLVIGAGMMGSAAAYDMARQSDVEQSRSRIPTKNGKTNRRTREQAVASKRVRGRPRRREPEGRHKNDERPRRRALRGPLLLQPRLAKAAIEAKVQFADLGGNNAVVRKTLALAKKAEKHGVALAPDCGLSPGMASILGGELLRRVGGKADALKVYVGGLPQKPKAPFNYQLVFSVEGLINEYCEPARILRRGKLITIEPLTEIESFEIERMAGTGGVSYLGWDLDHARDLRQERRRML